MIDYLTNKLKRAWTYLRVLLKWAVLASLLGVICGLVGSAFDLCVAWATQLRQEAGWLIFLLPAGGVFIAALYRWAGFEKDPGTNLVIASIRTNAPIPSSMAPLMFVSTTITHLFGGSAGREGAALQIGGSIGAQVGRWLKLDDKDLRLITMCGMSAVFAAIFGTPLTATLFAMEVISVGVLYYTAIIPCILSALVGFGLSLKLGVIPVRFDLPPAPALSVLPAIQVAMLAALCALVSILFCVAMHRSSALYQKYLPNPYLKAAAGGGAVILLTLLCGADYNGAGMDIIAAAVDGSARPEAFLLKIIFTALTLGAGFKGGEIIPTLFIGSTFGCVAGGLLGLDPAFGACVGMVALFCGVVNCPIASLILSVELFGAEGMVFFGLACGVSYMLSGYYSLYSSQKIVYSKLSPVYVDRETH